jgi:hypothetical protein
MTVTARDGATATWRLLLQEPEQGAGRDAQTLAKLQAFLDEHAAPAEGGGAAAAAAAPQQHATPAQPPRSPRLGRVCSPSQEPNVPSAARDPSAADQYIARLRCAAACR